MVWQQLWKGNCKMQAGYDENWIDTNDFKIVAIYARHAVEFGII